VQVHYDERIANYIGPEPCAGVREDAGEASVGVRIGQPSSRESYIDPGADAVDGAEGNMLKRVHRERLDNPAWSQTLACAETSCTGTGRSDDRPDAYGELVRDGKARSRSRR
jgi:hypothetical protein